MNDDATEPLQVPIVSIRGESNYGKPTTNRSESVRFVGPFRMTSVGNLWRLSCPQLQ